MKPPLAPLRDFAAALLAARPGGVAASLALLLAAGLTEGVSLLVFVPAVQLLQPGSAEHRYLAPLLGTLGVPYALGPVLALCAALVALRAGLLYLKTRCAVRLHLGFADALRLRLYRALGEARWECTRTLRGADLEELLTGGIDRVQSGVWALILLVQALVLLAVYLTLSALAAPAIGLLVALAGVGLLCALRGQRRQAARLGQRLGEDRQACFRELSALVHGLKVAKSFGTEGARARRFADTVAATRAGYLRYAALTAKTALLFQSAAGALLAAAIYLGARRLALDLPTLLVLVVCVVRLAPYLGQIQSFAQELSFALPTWQRLRALEARLLAAREAPPAGGERFTLRRQLQVEAVSVRYAGAARPALDGVSLCLPAGRCTALIGPSGAGKSTLADVLLGLLLPDSGAVRVDGQRLTADLTRAWRGRVGYVPQETFLLPETVRANLLLGDPQAGEAALWRALADAAAEEFVRALPQGLDTPLGERGERLSGGERQRLALARALLRKPLLLVLDEATSALDAANQARIGAALARLRGRVTVLLIAHRSPLVEQADQVLVLAGGRLGRGDARMQSGGGRRVGA